LRIKHRKVAVASPWTNGLVERVNRFIKSSLIKLCSNSDEWKHALLSVQYVINNTYHAVSKSTPSKLLLGYEMRNHDDYDFAALTKQLSEIEQDLVKERSKAREIADSATDLIRQYNKAYRDTHLRKPTMYKEGDYVLRYALEICVPNSSIAMRVLTQELRGECGARGALRGVGYDVTREGGLLSMTLRWRGRGKGR